MISVGADEVVEALTKELGCKTEKLHIKYLGLPIGASWRNVSIWDAILEIMELRLASWKKKLLNKAGRLMLIKSCLASLPIYYLSLFYLPVSVEKKMIKLMRNFLWGSVEGKKKMAWVGWTKVNSSKESGGLGVKNLRRTNKALDITTLWRKIVQQKIKENESLAIPVTDTTPQGWSLWKNVAKLVPDIQQFVSYTIKNGRSIRFWQDNWIDRGCLKDQFPIIYKQCRRKQATIAEMINEGRWEGAFRRNLDANERLECDLLRRDLGAVPSLVEENDEVSFSYNFIAKTFYDVVDGGF